MLNDLLSKERIKISYDSEKSYCVVCLIHHESEIELFKKNLLEFIGSIEIKRPKKVIWDLRKFEVVIDTELQIWIDNNINKKEFELGVRKEAFVLPAEALLELSVEQTMDENYGKSIQAKFFNNYDDAVKWLLL